MSEKLIRISNHLISIPQPKKGGDIINLNLKPEDAFWRRQEDIPKLFYDYCPLTKINQTATFYNQDGLLISLSEEDTKEVGRYLSREMHRRKHGVHMKNGEQIIWIHPDYYFNLQWGPMIGLPEKWGRFMWFQNDFCIIRGYGKTSVDQLGQRNIAGLFTTKPKKTGITQIMAGNYMNQVTMTKNVEFHMMSKSREDVEDVNLNFVFYIYDNLPYILKPREKKRNLTELLFGNPTKRTSGTTRALMEQFSAQKANVLNSKIKGGPTKESGFDGPLVYGGWVDEYPKLWEASNVSPDKVYKKTIETVKKGLLDIYGFLDYTSYVVETDDRGFEEARKVWFDSELSTIHPETRRTKSTMISHMITALESMPGYMDKFGRCDSRKANHFINMELAAKTESSEKLRLKRQYPRDADDAWGAGGISSTFDPIRLGECHKELDAEVRSGVRPWKEGKLVWENESWELGTVKRPAGQFCNVFPEWMDDEQLALGMTGRLKQFHEYHPEHLNRVLRLHSRHEDDDRLCPLPDSLYVGAFDPTDYLRKKDVAEGSKNAGHTFALYDPSLDAFFGDTASNIFYDEYFFRPDHPDEAYEDLVKSIIYTGKRVLVEGNKPWVCTKLIDDGLQHFLMVRKSDGSIAPYAPGDEKFFVYTTDKVIEAYCRAWALYIAKPKTEGTPDYFKLYKSVDGIKQLMNFDPLNTKKFDIPVSGGLTHLAVDAFSVFRQKFLESGGVYDREAMQAAYELLQDF